MVEATEKESVQERLDTLHEALSQQDLQAIHEILSALHPAEIALLLESLPTEQRNIVWEQVDPSVDGDILRR